MDHIIFSPPLVWFLIGVAFIVVELMVPGFIVIFFAAGCWLTAVAALVIPLDLTAQVTIFIVSSLILLFTLRKYSLKTFRGTTRTDIDDDYAASKIGKTAVVTRAIAPPTPGEIKCMGSFWRAVADEAIDEGKSVTIVSQESEDGLTFKVKPV